VQNFYIKIRQALLHPSCNPEYPWTNPTTLEDWRKDLSRKLDILVEIILHHQKADNLPPLKVVNDKLAQAESDPTPEPAMSAELPLDKIVVYCAFPSSYIQVKQVGRNQMAAVASIPPHHTTRNHFNRADHSEVVHERLTNNFGDLSVEE
jgi:hypothetical protein